MFPNKAVKESILIFNFNFCKNDSLQRKISPYFSFQYDTKGAIRKCKCAVQFK